MATINKSFLDVTVNGIKINSSKKAHSSNYNSSSARNVKYIVMHYTGNTKDKASSNANYFQRANCKASSHFFVDDTSIYQSVALKNIAWHCGASTYYNACRNSTSLAIEMCTSGDYKISSKTIENAAQLCAYLCKMVGITENTVDTYVVRHYDVTHKMCPLQMCNGGANDAEWIAFKKRVKEILSGKTASFKSYLVKINTDVLNVRASASASSKIVQQVKRGEVYTIVGEKMNGTTKWGKLKSGVGYISLAYTKRV